MKMLKQLKKNKGFTLVEVIVVAVIVAVLALVAIQLYQGYVRDARLNTAENLAASAASYLQTERNRGCSMSGATVPGGTQIAVTTPAGVTPANFTVPSNANVTFTGTQVNGGSVTAIVGSGSNAQTSQGVYQW